MSVMYESLRYEKQGRIGRLTFDRPGHRNALTRPMLAEVYQALVLAAADPELSVLVLSGANGDFCPGADFKGALAQNPDIALPPLDPAWFLASRLLHEMPAVTIAEISGACAGAGFSWACACDLRIAATNAKFNTAFLTVGGSGDMSGIWFVTRILGAAKARELFLLPDKFDVAEALRLGLVSAVHDPDMLAAGVTALAERLAGAPSLALAMMKANLVDAQRHDLETYLALETERHIRVIGSLESRAAFKARANSG